MSYDVFISYSHGGDDLLSERVQDGLSKFAKPWYRRRALDVFRDRTALSANPGLWSSIADAIDSSRYFLFLASPDAAASVWCGREVEHWRAKHGSDGLLVLLTDGEIRWDESANDFDWKATTALGSAFAGCFQEEPFHVDMRWARAEVQLDLTDGRFRDHIADLAAPAHGMAKDELTGEDVRQHRRALRQAVAAGVALVVLTLASIATSVFAVNAAGAARRSAARARTEQHLADVQKGLALIASEKAIVARGKATRASLVADQQRMEADQQRGLAFARQHEAELSAIEASQQRTLAESRAQELSITNANLDTANSNLVKGSLALQQSTLLAEARLAARRSEQLMSSGDQTYQLGVLLAAEAVRHACASSAINPNSTSNTASYPDSGCEQPDIQIDGSVANSALDALANAGGRFVTGQLAGSTSDLLSAQPYPVSWSSDSQRFATYSSAQSSRPDVVQVWNADGSLAANATSSTGLTSESALSGDGNVLALTSNAASGDGTVSAWSVASQEPDSGNGLTGRRPALSGNGDVLAWLAPNGAKAVDISTGQSPPRRIALPHQPVGVAINEDGSLATALVYTGGDDYALVPIDVATGKAGAAYKIGSFATPELSSWVNPPRISPDETADPPAVEFAPTGPTVWVYNNERHVELQVVAGASAPRAQFELTRPIPAALGGGNLNTLVTSTPDGRAVVLLNSIGSVPTYQVWNLTAAKWTTQGVVPLELCASYFCNLSISPNGTSLVASSLTALQIIDLQSPASTSSAIVPSNGAVPAGTTVVEAPTGQTALAWSAHSLAMIDGAAHTERRLSVPLGPDEAINAVSFDPSGTDAVAIIGHTGGCPCRVLILDAATGTIVDSTQLGATPLARIPDDIPVGVSLSDATDVVAVTFDDNAHGTSGPHSCALVTYSVATGQPLQVIDNQSVGLGEQTVSVPAFQPGTDVVALVATQGSSGEVGGVLLDARSGAILHTLSMSAGVVALGSGSFGNDGYALRFSPNGQLLAFNAGGTVAIWNLGSTSNTQDVASDVVLTSSSTFDPTALAISDNGEVATVGLNFYNDVRGDGTDVVVTGDELGRFLQPLGIARDVTPAVGQVEGQISVGMPADGEIAAVAIDFHGSRFFTDSWGASPATLLSQLCAAAPRALTPDEWQTYFPGETYAPACSPAQTTATWNINASPPIARPSVVRTAKPLPVRAELPSSGPVNESPSGCPAMGETPHRPRCRRPNRKTLYGSAGIAARPTDVPARLSSAVPDATTTSKS
ncbi:MAG: TIR domain-containing protein [Acidimicrobiia bacterium]